MLEKLRNRLTRRSPSGESEKDARDESLRIRDDKLDIRAAARFKVTGLIDPPDRDRHRP